MPIPPILAALLGWMLFAAPPPEPRKSVLENFESLAEGKTPEKGWQSRGKGEVSSVYRVVKEGENQFLRAEDNGKSIQFFREGGWDLERYPILSWRWRVHHHPVGSDERMKGKNDSAAALYIVFPRRFFIPEAIKYVWSATVPVETKVVRSSHFPMLVVRSGKEPVGTWVEEVRNIGEDYRKLFGRLAPNPVAIGFLTDANQTGSKAHADYDDIELRSAVTASK